MGGSADAEVKAILELPAAKAVTITPEVKKQLTNVQRWFNGIMTGWVGADRFAAYLDLKLMEQLKNKGRVPTESSSPYSDKLALLKLNIDKQFFGQDYTDVNTPTPYNVNPTL